MKNFRIVARTVGIIAFFVIIVIAAYLLGPVRRKTDVRFVLNWCKLGDKRIEKVIHSHISTFSFIGDYLDARAIKITHVDVAELTASTNDLRGRWYRGDQLPKVLDDALPLVNGYRHELPWFPPESELRSSEFYVYSWSIYYRGVRPTAAQLIFVQPSDKMVFYFGAKK